MCAMNSMNLWERVKAAGALLTRGADAFEDMPDEIKPPARGAAGEDPLTLSSVFRAVQVLQTAISGLPIVELRNGIRLESQSMLVMKPDNTRSRRDFISDIVASLALDGNAFVRIRRDFKGEIVTCEVLPPKLVDVRNVGTDPASPVILFDFNGRIYDASEIHHMKFLNIPGELRGLGPIQSARRELEGAIAARDCKSDFYHDSSNIKGYLRTEKHVTPEIARQTKNDWRASGTAADIKVVGDSLTYTPLDIKAEDLQFLQSQKFDTTAIARLMGVPASLMLAAVDGSNLTYANIEQSWIEFSDYTLAAYAGEIEELFDRLLPRGRQARFDWDSSRRANMSDRFSAWATAIAAGWLTVDDVRAREGLPPLNQQNQADGVSNES